MHGPLHVCGGCYVWATACMYDGLVLAVTMKSGDQSRLSDLHSKCQYENQRVPLVTYKNAVISCNSRLKRKKNVKMDHRI